MDYMLYSTDTSPYTFLSLGYIKDLTENQTEIKKKKNNPPNPAKKDVKLILVL